MKYISQLNGFWNWRTINRISHGEVDLYFALLHIANTTKWKSSFNVPNSTLLRLTHFNDNSALIKSRNKLVQSGLIQYQKGKDKKAGVYKIKCLYSNETDTEMDTEMDTDLDTEMDTIHRERKRQDKSKSITPIIPFEGELLEKVNEWLVYKSERGQKYKPTGLKGLFKKIQDAGEKYGESAVIAAIDNSISNNWQGLFFDGADKHGKEVEYEVYNDSYNHEELEELTRRRKG